MLTVALCNITAILFAYTAKYHKFRWGLLVSFIILFIFLALRYNYGNDYIAYKSIFDSINTSNSINIEEEHVELGWIILNIICKPFGFQSIIILWSLLYVIVFYKFIKKYVSPKWYWLAVAILTLDPSNTLIPLSMLRQSLCGFLFIISIQYLIEKKPIKYILIILFASFFHQSVLVLLPLFVLSYFNSYITVKKSTLMLFFLLSLFFISDILLNTFFYTSLNMMKKYQVYVTGEKMILRSGLGLAFNFLLLIVVLFSSKKIERTDEKIFVKIYYLYYCIIPFYLIVIALIRFQYYFTPFFIVVIPIAINKIKNNLLRNTIVILYLVYLALVFTAFFQNPLWNASYSTYQTIFSAY